MTHAPLMRRDRITDWRPEDPNSGRKAAPAPPDAT
jgi:hypothetical protein